MKLIKISLVIIGIILNFAAMAQNDEQDTKALKSIYNNTLTDANCYQWLTHICTKIGSRLSGSPQAAAAVEYSRQMLDTMRLDSVWLQPCMVNQWLRGEREQVRIINSPSIGSLDLNALSLGNSEGTGPSGLVAEVIAVQSVSELAGLGKDKLTGKIVFFNRPMDNTLLNTGEAYGKAVDQRVNGAAEASKYGAVAVLVRSVTMANDDFPHTGVTHYGDSKPIPALAISAKASNALSEQLKRETVRVFIRNTAHLQGLQPSSNVIGEIRGSEFPNEIILVGGHLDSWDVGHGAHDDGAGCVQAMEVLHQLKMLGYKPKRTIRAVLFMNEENGMAGAAEYAKESTRKGEKHIAAIESDAGGASPRGFTFDGDASILNTEFEKVKAWESLFKTYSLDFKIGGSGADISPLKPQKGLLVGFKPDGNRYFDYHHTDSDTIDKVNKRELELGAAAMTALVYMIDMRGL